LTEFLAWANYLTGLQIEDCHPALRGYKEQIAERLAEIEREIEGDLARATERHKSFLAGVKFMTWGRANSLDYQP